MTKEEKQKVQEENRIQHSERRKNRTEEEKQKVQEENRIQHCERWKNMTKEEKQKVKEENRIQHSERRKNMTEEEKQKVQDENRIQHSERRKNMTEEEKQKVQEEDRIQHSKRRKNMTEKEKVQEKNTEMQRKKRKEKSDHRMSLHSSYGLGEASTDEAVQDVLCEFFGNIQNGPTYECSVCTRFLYSTSVKHVSEQLVSQASNTIQVKQGRWICHTCANSIVKGKLPAQAIDNNLRAAEVPLELSSLPSLERQLVSKIIPFMKIVSLPKCSQRGLKGQVVLVPSNTTKTVSIFAEKHYRRSDNSPYFEEEAFRQIICF